MSYLKTDWRVSNVICFRGYRCLSQLPFAVLLDDFKISFVKLTHDAILSYRFSLRLFSNYAWKDFVKHLD